MIGSSLRFIRSVESCFHLGQFGVEIRFQVQVGESDERKRELYKYYNMAILKAQQLVAQCRIQNIVMSILIFWNKLEIKHRLFLIICFRPHVYILL